METTSEFAANTLHMTKQRCSQFPYYQHSFYFYKMSSICLMLSSCSLQILMLELQIPAGKPLMELVAVDWFKDVKRMDHVARRQSCAAQVCCLGHCYLPIKQ